MVTGVQTCALPISFLYAQKGQNLDRALEMAQQLVTAYPNDATTRDTLGWVFHRAGQHDKAITCLRQAAALSPDTGTIQLHLGYALWGAGRRAEGAEALRAALQHALPAAEKAEVEKLLAAR